MPLPEQNVGTTTRSSHATKGFSLIELLIVVAIIGIIAAIAVPSLLQSKAAANEAAAIGYMRAWTSAQELYLLKFGVYADADSQLFNEGLIGKGAADSHGYTFSLDNPSGNTDAITQPIFCNLSGNQVSPSYSNRPGSDTAGQSTTPREFQPRRPRSISGPRLHSGRSRPLGCGAGSPC